MPCISFPLVSVLSTRALRVSGEPIYSRSDRLAHADISSGEISAFVTWPPEPSAMTLQRPAIALFEEVLDVAISQHTVFVFLRALYIICLRQ